MTPLPSSVRLYAVRHMSTGNLLPASWNGTSHWNGEPGVGAPKLFKTAASAKGWRTGWLKGPLVKKYSQDWETGYEEIGFYHKPDPNRQLSSIDIIPVDLLFYS